MKYQEIKNLQIEELRKRMAQARQSLFENKIKNKMKRLSNTMEIRKLRRDIACLQMVLSQTSQKMESSPSAADKPSKDLSQLRKNKQKAEKRKWKSKKTASSLSERKPLEKKILKPLAKEQQKEKPAKERTQRPSAVLKPDKKEFQPLKETAQPGQTKKPPQTNKWLGGLFSWGRKSSKNKS